MRIFDVTINREENWQIAANSEDELDEALENARHELDDWCGSPWEWHISDPLRRIQTVAQSKKYPDKPAVPDMAVMENGEIVNWFDVEEDLMAVIEQHILRVKREIWQRENQLILPGVTI